MKFMAVGAKIGELGRYPPLTGGIIAKLCSDSTGQSNSTNSLPIAHLDFAASDCNWGYRAVRQLATSPTVGLVGRSVGESSTVDWPASCVAPAKSRIWIMLRRPTDLHFEKRTRRQVAACVHKHRLTWRWGERLACWLLDPFEVCRRYTRWLPLAR